VSDSYYNIIEAPCLVNGGHGASLMHHNDQAHRGDHDKNRCIDCDFPT
jgi:hypothetical protein